MPTFARGANPSPRHKLLAATPFRAVAAPPAQFAIVPSKLSYWDNEKDGVCVSSEEAYAKACWSVYCGLPEVFASESEVRNFAARHGWLNGADLAEVLDVMASEGMSIGGVTYRNGPKLGVDYSNETVLQSALATGPVKIAIDANALPHGAGNNQGWFSTAGGRYPNTDHCVGLSGYGAAGWLYQQLGVPLPSGLSPDTRGYLLFTWSTIGFVTHTWLMGTCTEAWVRTPTTLGESPAPSPGPSPGPAPTPDPTPTPPSPPVPVPPPVVVPPSYAVSVSGFMPGPFGRQTAVTLTGTATPTATHEHEPVGRAPFPVLLADALALYAAYQSKDPIAIAAAAAQLAADLKK